MKFSLATRVMSKTVLLALKCYYTKGEADETAKLCEMINDFFGCLNVCSFHEHERKRNALLAPYRSTTDSRFEWLENVFLRYLADWLSSTQIRAGSFTPHTKGLKCPCPFRHAKTANNSQVCLIDKILSG
jgi:hypothetical protein